MRYSVYKPGAALSKYIKCYWVLESGTESMGRAVERIFPDGCIELIFNYRDRFKRLAGALSHLQPLCFIHGQLKHFIEIEASGTIGIFCVRFHPGGLQPFLGTDSSHLTQMEICVDDLWTDGGILADKVLNAGSDAARIQTVEHFFLGKLGKQKRQNELASNCVRLIINGAGGTGIDQIAGDLNISKRQLERTFTSAVGITPKLFSRIVRFQRVLQSLELSHSASLTAVGYERGFYDQAHFIRDFKEFTGMSPGEYYADKPQLVNLFIRNE